MDKDIDVGNTCDNQNTNIWDLSQLQATPIIET